MTERRLVPALSDALALSGWETAPPDDPAEVSLTTVLQQIASSVSRIEEEERARIGVRLVPKGFKTMMSLLAHEHQTSSARLARVALDHGIAILDDQDWIAALRWAHRLTASDAMSRGDQDAMGRLDQTESYEFQRAQEVRATLPVSRETEARVAELARVCGLSTARLAVVTVVFALLTLRNNRGYRKGLIEEAKSFQRFVTRRTRDLLADGAESARSTGAD